MSTSVVVEGVSNVTWTGESRCSYGENQNCVILLDDQNYEDNTECFFVFKSSNHINIKHLHFTSSTLRDCSLAMISIHNCLFQSITFLDQVIGHGDSLHVANSTGWLNITSSLFMSSLCQFNMYSVSSDCPQKGDLRVNIFDSQFHYMSELMIQTVEESSEYDVITVNIEKCTFDVASELAVKVRGFPVKTFSITVRHSLLNFMYGLSALTVYSTILVSNSSSVLQMPVIRLENVTATGVSSALTLLASYKVLSNTSCVSSYPQIIVSNCYFSLSEDTANRDNVRLVHAVLNYTELDKNHLYHCSAVDTGGRPLLVFTGTSIDSNSIFSGIMYIEGFFWHRVSFGGDVVFRNNSCNVIQLQNSQLEIHGYNEIHSNNGEGIVLSPSSQLLFSNNSELSIRDNKVPRNGSGVRIEPTGDGIESFSEFVQCYIHKTVCPGWCFFQFIHSNGSAVNGEDLTTFTASLNISRNTYGNAKSSNIINGHVYNCSLKTNSGSTGLDSKLRLKFIQVKDDSRSINMIPYQICLCGGTQLFTSEHCNQTTLLHVYPGEVVEVYIRILKDFLIPLEADLTIITDDFTKRLTVAPTCSSVLAKRVISTQRVIILQTTPLRRGLEHYKVNHTLILQNQSCPIGTRENDNASGCVCSHCLDVHGFTCSMHKNETTYKASHPQSWLGMYRGNLMFSETCPRVFCNNVLLQEGITNLLDDSQCKNGRRGLLCSQCPPEKSVAFGSPECHNCSNWWLLMIPLYVLGGILVVVMLFTFNLTVLVGTINGAIFYSTLFWIMGDFFSVQTPLNVFESSLRFSFGFIVCLYDGMNEFYSLLIYFTFPFYLLLLVVLIIVSAHKLRLRIFTVPVISRRAVPVLATLMFMTYEKLTLCVIRGLTFSTFIDADTGESDKHWMFQPTLLYFRGNHLVLGILSTLVFLLYLIPFTVVMLFGDLLRMCIRSLWFSHFLDVFHGAYRYPFGFWFGLRLLLRAVLITLEATVPIVPYEHFAFITTLMVGSLWVLQIYLKPFRDRPCPDSTSAVPSSRKTRFILRMWNCFLRLQPSHFDSLFLVNSIVICLTALHSVTNEKRPCLYAIIVNMSLVLAIVEFIAIMVYHWKKFVCIPRGLKKRIKRLLKWRRRSRTCGNVVPVDDTAVHAIPIMTLELPPHNDTSSDDGSDQVDSDDSNQVDSDGDHQVDSDSEGVNNIMPSSSLCNDDCKDATRKKQPAVLYSSNTAESLKEQLLLHN